MKEDDPLAYSVGPWARRLSRQAGRAVRRLSPEGQAALSGIPLRREDLVAAVAALSALPRGAGAAAVGAATAPFRSNGSDAEVFLGRDPRDPRGQMFAPPGSCSFCDRASGELRCKIVSGPGVCICTGPRTAICHECVALFLEIFDHHEDEQETRARSLQDWLRHLSSPHPFLRCLAAVALEDWGLVNEPAGREALLAVLADTDWRVRALAEATLSNAGALPDGYRPSYVGRLRSLEFMDVFFAEEPSAIEGGAEGVDRP